jgi:hypothetical protein
VGIGLPDLAAWTPQDWSAAASVGTLLVALAATGIGWRQLKQARALREEEAAPFVVVDVVPTPASRWILDLVIENTGKTVARDVRITFDPPVESAADMAGYDLRDWSPLRDGIKSLAPGRRLTAMFDQTRERHASELPRQYEVRVECRGARGRRQPVMEYTVDLDPLYGALYVEEKGLHNLVQEVEKLRKAVEPITRKPLTVEVYDAKEVREERAQRHEEWRRRMEQGAQGRPDLQAGLPSEEGDQ